MVQRLRDTLWRTVTVKKTEVSWKDNVRKFMGESWMKNGTMKFGRNLDWLYSYEEPEHIAADEDDREVYGLLTCDASQSDRWQQCFCRICCVHLLARRDVVRRVPLLVLEWSHCPLAIVSGSFEFRRHWHTISISWRNSCRSSSVRWLTLAFRRETADSMPGSRNVGAKLWARIMLVAM